ncbi:hypothetical protein SBOR_2820 [Sclerotinia borealis F-4128]|uniref:Uncharacterized protein n=1 Tax=Sclerotinia borealis (strain F-4128) TaxID=1432307 RepID=W9CQF2_SCLBF|nr:hypothetical protein SBOR_2820 [Sclerotinia borealis F-4128]
MLSRTLFREGTLVRRQRQIQRQRQIPRVSIFTEENVDLISHPTSSAWFSIDRGVILEETTEQEEEEDEGISPEQETRAQGIVSPVSPLSPDLAVQTQAQAQAHAHANVEIEIEPATPSSELEPHAHWYFNYADANHYHEKHVSIREYEETTNLQLLLSPDASVSREETMGKWEKWRSVGLSRVREWLKKRQERKAAEKAAEKLEKEGDLVVGVRVLEEEESISVVEEEEERKGARGKAKDIVRRGTNKLRKLSPEGGRKEAKLKGVWREMRRIRGFQHIE